MGVESGSKVVQPVSFDLLFIFDWLCIKRYMCMCADASSRVHELRSAYLLTSLHEPPERTVQPTPNSGQCLDSIWPEQHQPLNKTDIPFTSTFAIVVIPPRTVVKTTPSFHRRSVPTSFISRLDLCLCLLLCILGNHSLISSIHRTSIIYHLSSTPRRS